MKRFRVQYKGQVLNMSLPATGILEANLHCVDCIRFAPSGREEITLLLTGWDSTNGKQLEWEKLALTTGDRVVISVHDDRRSDEPLRTKRRCTKEEGDLEQRELIRVLASKWGWKIVENTSEG